ncbi:MAG: hypothetical protein IKT61_00130 [Clostridia bacterium]|nr:hypothetical protein [Clostridia bacterium]
MADTKKRTTDSPDAMQITVPADLEDNNNLEEYIQPSSLDLLKARYAAIDVDEEIRNEGFELAKKSGLLIKQRPENPIYGYFSDPVNPKDEIRTDVNSPLSQVFEDTKSEFDANNVTFSDISFEQKKKDAEAKAEAVAVEEKPKRTRTTKAKEEAPAVEEKPKRTRTTKAKEEAPAVEEKPKRTRTTNTNEEAPAVEEKPKRTRTTKTKEEAPASEEKPKRTRTTKAKEEAPASEEKPKRTRTTKKKEEAPAVEEKPKRTRTTKKKEEPVPEATEPHVIEVASVADEHVEEAPAPVMFNRYGYNTHTRVIYVDESADDGIKRNSEEELSSIFTDKSNKKKRRLLPWLQKKK